MRNKTVFWVLGIAALLLAGGLLWSAGQPKDTVRKPQTATGDIKRFQEEPTITVYLHSNNTRQSMPLEKYLVGVVAAEIGSQAPLEALKAQAIASRSMTLAKIKTGGIQKLHNADACDLPEHFQAYDTQAVTPAIRQAVAATRGQVVLYKNNVAYALYCSYAGMKTAALSEAFPELIKAANPYIKVLSSPGAKYAPARERSWKVAIPKDELLQIFGEGANIDAIKVASRGPSGRAINISAGSNTVKAYTLRMQLGGERLRSTLIKSISVQGDKVVFTGEGWGHGCGMSQWGAYEMAKKNKTARQIVNYYFPGTRLYRLWK